MDSPNQDSDGDAWRWFMLSRSANVGVTVAWIVVLTVVGRYAVAKPDVTGGVENETLRRALSSMSPGLSGTSLSATCLRTEYVPRALITASGSKETTPQVKAALTSEILVNNKQARESVRIGLDSSTGNYSLEYSRSKLGLRMYHAGSKSATQRLAPHQVSSAQFCSCVGEGNRRTRRRLSQYGGFLC